MIYIHRQYEEDWTNGILTLEDDHGKVLFRCFTLELPYLDNQRQISCINAGEYESRVHFSPKNGKVLSLDKVPDRTHIQVHAGNFTHEIEGCILVGDSMKFLDSDHIPDVTNSKATLKKLLSLVPKTINIRIY